MPKLIMAVIDGAWDESVAGQLAVELDDNWNDLTSYFAVNGRTVQETYRGVDTEPAVLAQWKQDITTVTKCSGVVLVPAAFAECSATRPLLADLTAHTPALLVTTSVTDAWRRLHLNVPGLPPGLGPIRATWIRMQQQRVEAWKSLGAEIIDTSHCDATQQAKTLQTKIHAKISLS